MLCIAKVAHFFILEADAHAHQEWGSTLTFEGPGTIV